MTDLRTPWMLTVAQLRAHIENVPDDVVVVLVRPPSTSGGLSNVESVGVSYAGGAILRLSPVTNAVSSNSEDPDPVQRESQPTDIFLNAFGFTVARAGCFELTARMLADKTPVLQSRCLSEELTPLCRALTTEYASALTEEETKLLGLLPGVRNMLFHIQFSRVQGRIRPLAETLKDAGVTQLNLDTGEAQPVSRTSTSNGRIFGWLIEATASGAFTAAADKFLDGIILLERLMVECDRRAARSS